MLSRKKLLSGSNLYLILDTEVNDYDQLFDIARKAVRAGVDIVQLRDKSGSSRDTLRLVERLRRAVSVRCLFIVNDRVDLALASGADGVHLGQQDLFIDKAREIMGKKAIIGISCQSLTHAHEAGQSGADYIGLGSVFKTQTKPHRRPMVQRLLSEAYQKIKIPVFAIGGICLENVEGVLSLGCNRVAVCRAVCQSKNIEATVKDFKQCLEKSIYRL